jgi:hypothetical protein
MDKPWFDQESGTLMLDECVVQMDRYRRIVEDEAITDEELVEQTQRVASLLRAL